MLPVDGHIILARVFLAWPTVVPELSANACKVDVYV